MALNHQLIWRELIGCGTAAMLLAGCGGSPKMSSEGASDLTPVQLASQYVPRIGIGVRTDSRVCIAIKNGNLAPSSPLTLVIARSPQAFVLARIKAIAENACPITKELEPGMSNYELMLPNGVEVLPKLTPMIAVVGDSGDGFMQTNITVQADLDHDGRARQFRACNSSDGVHLTVWAGTPLTSGLIWSGFYYQAENASPGAACTPAETKSV